MRESSRREGHKQTKHSFHKTTMPYFCLLNFQFLVSLHALEGSITIPRRRRRLIIYVYKRTHLASSASRCTPCKASWLEAVDSKLLRARRIRVIDAVVWRGEPRPHKRSRLSSPTLLTCQSMYMISGCTYLLHLLTAYVVPILQVQQVYSFLSIAYFYWLSNPLARYISRSLLMKPMCALYVSKLIYTS